MGIQISGKVEMAATETQQFNSTEYDEQSARQPSLALKGFVGLLIVTLLFYLSPVPYAYANPVGGNVSAGSATISSSGNTETINQTSNRAVIDWSKFNIG